MTYIQAETTVIPQGLVLGPSLFNIFASNKDSRIEFTASKFSNFAKIPGVADMLERRDDTQEDLSRLDEVLSNPNQITKYGKASK